MFNSSPRILAEKKDFYSVLPLVRSYISDNYSDALDLNGAAVKAYIAKYLNEQNIEIEGFGSEDAVDALYCEMAAYSVLTPLLSARDVEEININAWDDIAVSYTDGRTEKLGQAFSSPQQALDILKRLLHHSGMVIDNATPVAQGHLPGNSRITVLKTPLVDESAYVSASIRILHPSEISLDQLEVYGTLSHEMRLFLETCLMYGISFIVAGETSSGKTTLLNALLNSLPDSARIFTIETGARELSLVRRSGDGTVRNNTVHTLSRQADQQKYSVSQEDLVAVALRFNPKVIVVGEMRDTEAYAAVEAALTGHTVVSTVHARAGEATHTRISLLCQKRFPIAFETSMLQSAQAFPIVVFCHRMEDGSRKVLDISECVCNGSGQRKYRTIFSYNIEDNSCENGETRIRGHFSAQNPISGALCSRLKLNGAPAALTDVFTCHNKDQLFL